VEIARPGSAPPAGSLMATNVLPPEATVGTAYCWICSGVPRQITLGGSQPKAPAAGV